MPIKRIQTDIAGADPDGAAIPAFEPHPWLWGGHAQTIAGRYWPIARSGLDTTAHQVDLGDGDRLVVLESVPPGGESARPTAGLVHGLAGRAEAPYMVRLGLRLVRPGV